MSKNYIIALSFLMSMSLAAICRIGAKTIYVFNEILGELINKHPGPFVAEASFPQMTKLFRGYSVLWMLVVAYVVLLVASKRLGEFRVSIISMAIIFTIGAGGAFSIMAPFITMDVLMK